MCCRVVSVEQMASNGELKEIFQQITEQFVSSVNANAVIDRLLQDKVISSADYATMIERPFTTAERTRFLFGRLLISAHPEAFVILRKALMKEYDWLVKEVDRIHLQTGWS